MPNGLISKIFIFWNFEPNHLPDILEVLSITLEANKTFFLFIFVYLNAL